jgi:hypothetical protein
MWQYLPCVSFQEDVKTPFSDQLMQWMNVKEESNQKMVHQIGKKQLACQVTCKFQTPPVMQYNSINIQITIILVKKCIYNWSKDYGKHIQVRIQVWHPPHKFHQHDRPSPQEDHNQWHLHSILSAKKKEEVNLANY